MPTQEMSEDNCGYLTRIELPNRRMEASGESLSQESDQTSTGKAMKEGGISMHCAGNSSA
jgi:hypothetical protein